VFSVLSVSFSIKALPVFTSIFILLYNSPQVEKPARTSKPVYWFCLALLALAGTALAWLTTAPYGAGVGADGAIQLATADHLIAGQGFFDYAGDPYLRWPPLYPVLLAAAGRLTGASAFTLGWLLNVVLMGVIIGLGGLLLRACFPGHPAWSLAGALVLLTSASLLGVCANIGNDPLFAALALLFLLLAGWAGEANSLRGWLALGLLGSLASLQRLPGVTLIAAGALLCAYAQRADWRKRLAGGLLFGAASALPLAGWVLGHNYLLYKTFFGFYAFQATYPLENLKDAVEKMTHWFVPLSAGVLLPALGFAGAWLALLLTSRRADWLRLARRLRQPVILACLVFGLIYLPFLIFTANSVDTRYAYFDRYYLALLPPLLVLAFAILQTLVAERLPPRWSRPAGLLAVAVFAVWLVYPAFNVYKYVVRSRADGVATYNKYNTRQYRQSPIIQAVEDLSARAHLAMYSNYPAAVWFYTRREAYNSPRGEIVGVLDPQKVMQSYQGWPYDRPGYLVWFLPNEYDHVLEPRLLAQMAELRLVYRGEDGLIYHVQRH
jgi:4-amino-4-deoxy-L-arabinose transferase-like glycosyltransferase